MQLFAHQTSTEPALFQNEWLQHILAFAYAILPLVLLLVVATYLFRAKPGTKLIFTMVYLFAAGLAFFQWSPAVAIVCLSAGLALTLSSTLIGLKH